MLTSNPRIVCLVLNPRLSRSGRIVISRTIRTRVSAYSGRHASHRKPKVVHFSKVLAKNEHLNEVDPLSRLRSHRSIEDRGHGSSSNDQTAFQHRGQGIFKGN